MNFVRTLFAPFAAFLALMLGMVQRASAAVPADVTTALADIKTDALAVAGVILLAIVAIYAFKFLKKAL